MQQADTQLIALQDERDHLTVKLSLLSDAGRRDLAAITRVKLSLAEIERRIATHQPHTPQTHRRA